MTCVNSRKDVALFVCYRDRSTEQLFCICVMLKGVGYCRYCSVNQTESRFQQLLVDPGIQMIADIRRTRQVNFQHELRKPVGRASVTKAPKLHTFCQLTNTFLVLCSKSPVARSHHYFMSLFSSQ